MWNYCGPFEPLSSPVYDPAMSVNDEKSLRELLWINVIEKTFFINFDLSFRFTSKAESIAEKLLLSANSSFLCVNSRPSSCRKFYVDLNPSIPSSSEWNDFMQDPAESFTSFLSGKSVLIDFSLQHKAKKFRFPHAKKNEREPSFR